MEKFLKAANLYVATLRELYLILQYCHWISKGQAFYSDHLLFERLYKSAAEDADLAAEKMIGLFGSDGVDYSLQTEFMTKLAVKYKDLSEDPVSLALKAEKEFLNLSKDVHAVIDEADQMTFGLEDMIMAIASNRETSVYLLSQVANKQE